jgi:hypothetical protein
VPAASHRDELLVLAREANRGDHVGHAGAAGDQPWATIDGAVPDPPLLIVGRILRADQDASERCLELIDRELRRTCNRNHEYLRISLLLEESSVCH